MSTEHKLTELLNRREALAAAGVAGLGLGAYALLRGSPPTSAATGSSCILTPELTEGPYYIDENLIRRDITEGKDGAALQLRLTVEKASTCKPIRNATVEVWHCDALGNYSGFDGATPATTYLRGGQKTNSNGLAIIDTIYPGWYQGRTTHIHIKVHAGGSVVHTGQLFFKDSLNAAVYATSPYATKGQPDTTDSSDSIYSGGGSKSVLAVKRKGSGYVGRLTMGVKV
jgi:protocatechuate 3,4-dioxygenase beta subunit